MKNIKDLFLQDFSRPIETVIKADDRKHVLQEVEEYVITNTVASRLADFFEDYTHYDGKNGIWISGFFGSGKSHLLKILSYVLENTAYEGKHLGELFADKITDDAKLKGDILKSTRDLRSESILFNIDQQAQITSKADENAILQVFYKVFYDHQGFFGFQPHVAEFESYLAQEGKFEDFKAAFARNFKKDWETARNNYVDPMVGDALAEACAEVYGTNADKYEDYLDTWEDRQKYSIEDFAQKVNHYVQSKGSGFRLNFFVDEVGQFIAENTRLMLNLQTIAESLNTVCAGNSWVIVTSQEDLESLVGDDSRVQSDDFSKIQGRFPIRMPLTSANVDEVIEKRLLQKNASGSESLTALYNAESENLKTLLSFSNAGIKFSTYKNPSEFVNKYPFIPYQFDLFQQSIKALSRHNAFQGKHQSVGERSMLGVFQDVLKKSTHFDQQSLVSFDLMFEGIRATLKSEVQNSVLLAEKNITSELAIRALKVLFLVKYFDNFKTTARNVSILLLDNLGTNAVAHLKATEEALTRLEEETYIERKGEIYEFLTDAEKDIENEIKDTGIDANGVSQMIKELVFDGIIKDSRIKYRENGQDFDFTPKVDGGLFSREKELTIEVISTEFDQYGHEAYFTGSTISNHRLMIIRLPAEKRFIADLYTALKTDKYLRQRQNSAVDDGLNHIFSEKGRQNTERKRSLENIMRDMLARGTYYLNGTEHKGSNASDGRNKVFENFQDLIQLAYAKLSYLGSVRYDEKQLQLIKGQIQADLFAGEKETQSAAERDVLAFITRRKTQADRTALHDLKEHFSKVPYGWPEMAVWCTTALLFKRGKVEAKQDTNVLDDRAFFEGLTNVRLLHNILISPQVEFDQKDIQRVKTVYQETFGLSNPGGEAKDIAGHFKTKAGEEAQKLQVLLGQAATYPFLNKLRPFYDLLKRLSDMDYAVLINSLKEFENTLLDDKEDLFDPISQFMNGEQKKIFDSIVVFQQENQANFEHIEAAEKRLLEEVISAEAPYQGQQMKLARTAMDQLAKRLKEKLEEQRKITVEAAQRRINDLQEQASFAERSPEEQEDLLEPLQEIVDKASRQNYIASLQLEYERLPNTFTNQLNALSQLENKVQDSSKPQYQYVRLQNLGKKVPFAKVQLESKADVEAYIEALKSTLLTEIDDNRKITLD